MEYCKLFVIASILFFGIVYGQLRFQRHLNTTATTTQIELEQGLPEVNGLNRNGELELTSDYGDVVLKESHENVEVELSSNGQLKFRVCSDGCTNKEVTVCYDAVSGSINKEAKVGCGENQCGIKAGVKLDEYKQNVFYFMTLERTLPSSADKFCGEAAMKYPKATISGYDASGSIKAGAKSCEPVKHDGNVVKLYVQQVYPGCSIKVLNAKRWYPATTALPATALPLSTPLPGSNTTSSSSSNADNTWWIVGGIIAGILVIIAILGGIGCCVYRNHQQKKDAAAAKAKAEHDLKYASLESLPTLDLATTTTAVQKEEQEKPKKEDVVKKDKTEKKQKHKKVEAAPPPPKVMASKEAAPSVRAKKLPSNEATTEGPKIKPLKEKCATKAKEVEKKPAKMPKNAMKVAQKEVVVVAPPPPPRRKAATPRQTTVDKTQEESPSLEKQNALEDVSSSPSIEKKPPKKAPSKKAAKKRSKKCAPPPTPPPRRRHSSNKVSSRQHDYSWERPRGFSSQEWMEIKSEKRRPPYIEYNPTGRRY